jgi:trigger factor
VNVTVENLSACKKLVRVELEATAVDAAFESVARDFQRNVRLPGYRPGKAPRDMVVKTFSKDIESEVRRKLIPEALKKAFQEHKIRPIDTPEIEEIQFGRGQAFQFATTIEIQPQFELPEYKGLKATREQVIVSDADVETALVALREQRGDFKDVSRPSQTGDFVVVNYTGTCDGKPISETAPTARGLTEQKDYWLEIKPGSFIPGFTEQLAGASTSEKRTVSVDFPADFVSKELSGKKGVYEVEVRQVKERVLPELNDAFAKTFGAADMQVLRDGVRRDLLQDRNYRQNRAVRDQLIKGLLDRVTFELPESVVLAETKAAVDDIVRRGSAQGATKEAIVAQKEQIFSMASQSAKERVRVLYLLHRVAEKEAIKASDEELSRHLSSIAQEQNMPVVKLVRQFEKDGRLGELSSQIVVNKVIDFLQLHATIEEVPASASATAPAATEDKPA